MDKFKEIIEKTVYLTLATVDENGQPWNTPVFGAYDEANNFYWGSHRESQHSKNVRANGKVYLVIYDSTAEAGTGEGAYIKASAQELSDVDEIALAHSLLQDRRPVPYWKLEQVQGEAPVRLYKAVPEKLWLNGEGEVAGTYVDTLKEVAV